MLLLTHYHGGITGKGERMKLPSFTMKELLEAGIHFGHQVNRWNPKMQTYLFGERNGIHIIDLQQTMPLLHPALRILKDVASGGGRILFVGTKRQAQNIIEEKNFLKSTNYICLAHPMFHVKHFECLVLSFL